MKRILIGLAVIAGMLLLGACTSIPIDENFQARETAKSTAVTACATAVDGKVAECMLGVALAFSDEYRRAPTGLEQATGMARVIAPAVVSLGGQYAGIEIARFQRDTEIARQTTFERIFMRQADSGDQPNLVVNGNYGDTYGDDFTGGDRSDTRIRVAGNFGDTETTTTTTTAGRDMIGRDRTVNSGVIGDQNDTRIRSPGPIDVCSPGTFGCGVTNPLPDPEPTPDPPAMLKLPTT